MLFAACTGEPAPVEPTTTASLAPSTATPLPATPTLLPNLPTATSIASNPTTIYLSGSLPAALTEAVVRSASLAQNQAMATYTLQISPGASLIEWVYALAAPFPTITDGVGMEDLLRLWQGQPGSALLVEEGTLPVLAAWWGEPAQGAVLALPAGDLLEYAWAHQPSWAILPFEDLEPRWKVLEVDGQSPVRRDFDAHSYPLTMPVTVLDASGQSLPELPPELGLPVTNRNPSHLTVLDMSGVTAMVRGTALWMERYGITYPAVDLLPVLATADLTHVSNEIPFIPNCPYPELYPTGLLFCSNPAYIELLQAIGTDLVELTGDHLGDYGPEAAFYTLELYHANNLPVYGGGVDAQQARQPLLVEHNGNRLAFLGCNIGCQVKNEVPCEALATEERPGAALCDFDWLETQIGELSSSGYQVIVTLQHKEYYTYTAEADLVQDFGRLAQAGAAIVSGSQAHQPHGFAFQSGAFIHYGLGNLFFDQYHFCAGYACDDAFIDRHVFYEGRHISTELITIHFIDLARSRLMTPDERQRLLEIIFTASGW